MSEDDRPTTCRLDPEVELVESALPPTPDEVEEETPDSEVAEQLEPEERATVEATLTELEPELKAIAPSDVKPYRTGAAAAVRNAKRIVKSLKEHMPRLRKELPYLEHHRLERLARVSFALAYVVASATRMQRVGPTRRDQQTSMYRVRRLLLDSLIPVARKGLIPQEELNEIMAGTGVADALEDIMAMLLIFDERWSLLKNKTPVEQSDLQEARDIVETMYPRVRPDGGLEPEPMDVAEIIEYRDRIWTLLLRDHKEAIVAGTYLSRDKESVEIPPLLSGARRSSAVKKKEAGDEEKTA